VGYRNGERAVVEAIDATSLVIRRLDGSAVRLDRARPLSLDHSYAVTGHSAQAWTFRMSCS